MQDPTLFLYCPKLVVFSEDKQAVLLARRAKEDDYDGVFSLIGGKTETTDGGLLEGLKREKIEEIGADAHVTVCWRMSCWQEWFQKSNGKTMVLPHHVALYRGGEITLNKSEYAEYRWVPLTELAAFKPLIPNIPQVVAAAQRWLPALTDADFDEL
jgi:ADP-ribose pyrophosphatase YjhB (NUDIX family)